MSTSSWIFHSREGCGRVSPYGSSLICSREKSIKALQSAMDGGKEILLSPRKLQAKMSRDQASCTRSAQWLQFTAPETTRWYRQSSDRGGQRAQVSSFDLMVTIIEPTLRPSSQSLSKNITRKHSMGSDGPI